jgi:4a-hydroxytetrahydrobiopterin dehydratase
MSNLAGKTCVACDGSIPPFTEQEITEYKKEINDAWKVHNNSKIQREFIFSNFKEAMNFINTVARIAEHEGHHPDISIFYNKVLVSLWTHAVGGLTESDFIMAAKIDEAV